jgi:glycosyltransferase involved in cell wall biosynthesis
VLSYKRPALLAACLDALGAQKVDGFGFSIVVVDNDVEQSARGVAKEWAAANPIRIDYEVEPEKNISRARNKAVAKADGRYIAFIDDDESAERDWLWHLYHACVEYRVDGVLGPVLPSFEGSPPAWFMKSGLSMRASFPTGTRLLDSRYMRTGNVIFARDLVRDLELPFDPRLGLSGGEDADFFDRMLSAGRSFVWCEEARVHERVPEERQKLRYHLRRALIRGVTEADRRDLASLDTLKSVIAVAAYALALPFLFILSYRLFARYLVSCADHVAKLLAHFGIRLARERTF